MPTKLGYITPTLKGYIIFIHRPVPSRWVIFILIPSYVTLTLSLQKCCNFTPRNVHERFQTLLTHVLTIFTDFLSAIVTSEIAQIPSLYGGGF